MNVKAQLTIQIVGWNSARDLPRTLAALQQLPPGQVIIRYIDNASHDTSVELVHAALPSADIIELPENHGFAGAHNIGFARCTTPYVLVHDPDLEIAWPALQKLIDKMNSNPAIGAIQGKLLRQEKMADGTPLIDSAGIVKTRALNGQERGANEADRGQYNLPIDVFATTGACSLYRTKALKDVIHRPISPALHLRGVKLGQAEPPPEVYDQHFFAYKEDVDLGWRLNRAGWRVAYEPVTVGIHRRTLGPRGFMNWGLNPGAVYQRLKSPRTRYSLRNWLWMIIKNATPAELLLHSPFILARLAVFFAFSLIYPPLLTVWPEIIRGLPRMIEKREQEKRKQ